MSMAPALGLADLTVILPLIVLTVTALCVMLLAAARRHHATAATLTVAGLLTALAMLPLDAADQARAVTPLFQIDAYVLTCWCLMLLIGLAVTAMAWQYWQARPLPMEEFYTLLLMATLGACVLVAARHFAALFIGLELMTVSLIAMIGYPVCDDREAAHNPLESALKYLVLSAVSSAILLFGIALLYAETGSLDFSSLLHSKQALAEQQGLYLLLGLGLIISGLGFKLSLVPFHLWTPDVYQGAPAPVTAFVATLSKGAVLALLLRYILLSDMHSQPLLLLVVSTLAVASMLVGNLLALMQDNPKRLLAYSSIGHMGYAMLALLLAGAYAAEALVFYLLAYLLMTLAAFAVLAQVRVADGEPERLDDLRGLIWQQPLAGLTLGLMMLSLAGIPLTIGFVGKFYLVGAAVQGELWVPLLALLIGSVLGLFYYLRIVVLIVSAPDHEVRTVPITLAGRSLLFICSLAALGLGIFPAIVISLLRAMSLAVS